jgi:hypothetical protein
MLDGNLLRGYELDFLIGIGLSLLAGFLIGAEREARVNQMVLAPAVLLLPSARSFIWDSNDEKLIVC